MNLLKAGVSSRRGTETQGKTISVSVFIRVYRCSSVAQKALAEGAAL